MGMYRAAAQRRGMEFDLTDPHMSALFAASCYYCGVLPGTVTNKPGANGQFTYNGIDRYDNALGYVASNVVTCCKECNWAKGARSGDEFLAWLRRVAAHQALPATIRAVQGTAVIRRQAA